MRILAIGAHPDDLEFGCGGTLLKFSSFFEINLLIMTKGEIGGSGEVRAKEQERSAKLLKAKLYWGGYADTQIPFAKEVIDKIEEVIRITKPQLIFVHYPNDTHQDHKNVADATITATRYIRNVLFYEVPTSVDFSPVVFVDISETLKDKFKLLKIHKSQVYATKVKGLSIIESARSTAIFRGYQNRVKYAEGFIPLRLALDFYITERKNY